MRFVNYLYFSSNDPKSEKYYKACFITQDSYITKEEFKRVEKAAREHIYGNDAGEDKVPILISKITVVEG